MRNSSRNNSTNKASFHVQIYESGANAARAHRAALTLPLRYRPYNLASRILCLERRSSPQFTKTLGRDETGAALIEVLLPYNVRGETLTLGSVRIPVSSHSKKKTPGAEATLRPEIAKKHFGFEFWLTFALFLFVAGMIITRGFLRAGQAARDAGHHLLTAHDRAR